VDNAAVGGVLPRLEEINFQVEVGVVRRYTVEITEAVAEAVLVAEAPLGGVRAGRPQSKKNV
jgi:hypothetical protein